MDFFVRLSVEVSCMSTLVELNALCGSFIYDIFHEEKT